MNILKKIRGLFSGSLFIIADASDNSITLSKRLCHHMRVMELKEAKVFVFKTYSRFTPTEAHYAFVLNPRFTQDTQLADIQYNSKYKTIGFETLNPTVNRIFYDYGLEPLIKVKLTVKPRKAGDCDYYEILPPAPQTVKPDSSPSKIEGVGGSMK